MARDFGVNQGLVEELYLLWAANPFSVDEDWRKFFDSLPPEEQPVLTSAGFFRAPERGDEEHGGNGNGHAPSSREPANGSVANGQARREARAAAANGPATYGAHANGRVTESDSPGEPGRSSYNALPATAEVVPIIDRRRRDRRQSFPPSSEMLAANELQGRVSALVNAYRVRGHLFASLDPLALTESAGTQRFLEEYGLTDVDLDTVFSTGDLAGPATLPLREIVRRLDETYCRSIGVEFTFLDDPDERLWLQERMEETQNRLSLTQAEQKRILTKLTDAEIFEQFLHTNYLGAKRFSLEGAESVIPMLDLCIDRSAQLGVEEIVIGMAHRGRLNVLANIMDMDPRVIFAIFEDQDPERLIGRGDVKYHLGYSTDREVDPARNVHLTLSFNPSHLEFVSPVVEGRVRAKGDRRGDREYGRILPLLIHGDAAFIGQGVVAETLNLSRLDGYRTGGTLHVVINNQIGFTTKPGDARSSNYCTDITRLLRCPVFHVNGEDPEAVVQVANLATEYRQRFHKDVAIDLYCYRKYGHNEGDEPRFTQPMMYGAIDQKRTVREVYVERLKELGTVTDAIAEELKERKRGALEAALEMTRNRAAPHVEMPTMGGVWSAYSGGRDADTPDADTSVPRERLVAIASALAEMPASFELNRKLRTGLFQQRRDQVKSGEAFDWGTAEWLAYGSLLLEGTPIRLTGQDSRRGTFAHRHAVVYDTNSGKSYCPLAHLGERLGETQARFEIYDSPLSEAGVLGFEYGYSLDSPDALVLWEAQFGDFVNGAQVIIDQFICSSEDKWHRLNAPVLLLPHGFEGSGPEHSSARLERFLTQCAEDNMQVVNLTTPAQLFHCLRRQVVRKWRKPLVVMTPKSLLRRRSSTVDELANGGFQRVIPDDRVEPAKAKRVLLCTGKLYYELLAARDERHEGDIAIVRLEQLYPLRAEELRATMAAYPANVELVWVQEEPWNMGAWFSLHARLPRLGAPFNRLRCVSRPESASPATGSPEAHKIEQKKLIDEALSLE